MCAGKAPWLEVETSTFAEDWQKMVEEPRHTDTVFIVDNKHRLQAHKVVLAAASKFMARVLGVTECTKVRGCPKINTVSFHTIPALLH